MAKDRVISTVDPEARHGHKSRNRRFDGYKTHLSVDPDSELIDEVAVTPANMPDRDAVSDLLEGFSDADDKPDIVGDSAYADGATRQALSEAGFEVVAKVPPVRNAAGLFTKDRFSVDLETQSVTCPAGQRVAINPTRDGGGRASFKIHCKDCPLRKACTKSRAGRTITIGRHEGLLQMARAQQRTPQWQARYRADRPKVERKISHFMPRAWGGRNARVRGRRRIGTDVDTRAGRSIWPAWPSWVSPTTVRAGAWRGRRGPRGVSRSPRCEFPGSLVLRGRSTRRSPYPRGQRVNSSRPWDSYTGCGDVLRGPYFRTVLGEVGSVHRGAA